MKIKIIALLCATGILGMLSGFAQTTPAKEIALPAEGVAWSLDDCIRYAEHHNISVQQRALMVDQGEIDLHASQMARLPDLTASLGYNVSFGRGTSSDNTYKTETLQTGSLGIDATAPLFNGFALTRKIRGRKLDLAATLQDFERAREDVALNVTSLYLQVLFNKELTLIAEQQLALSTQQTLRSRALVSEGKNPESALYESEALQSNDALKLTQARNTLALALLDLSQAVNRPSAIGFDVQTPNSDSLTLAAQASNPGSAQQIYDYAAENRPHIRAERLRLSSSENSVRVARSSLYPTISLRGGYGTGVYSSMNEAFGLQLRKNSSEYIGLSLRIPIFNRLTARTSIRTAKVSARNQQLTLNDAEQKLHKQIEQAWFNATGADAKFRAAVVARASARLAFDYEQRRAETGRSTIFDFSDAKTRMEKAESELAQARFELIFRHKILDFYRGEALQL